MKQPLPIEIKLHQKSRKLEILFDDGQEFVLSCEYLRVFSPSAEVQGHSPEQRVLQYGKENVTITTIEPIGNYAVRLVFDDGHSTGLYSWTYLYSLGRDSAKNWKSYSDELTKLGYQRQVQET